MRHFHGNRFGRHKAQQSVNKNRKLWCNKTVISPLVVAVPDLQPLPLGRDRDCKSRYSTPRGDISIT